MDFIVVLLALLFGDGPELMPNDCGSSGVVQQGSGSGN
jgi:hypothetical protein